MFEQVIHAINGRHMSYLDMSLIAVLGGSIALVMAWFTDTLMERISLGVLLNAILMIAGAALGLCILVWAGFPPTRNNVLPAVFVCGLSGVLMLMFVASFKRAI
jgi:hypothetical protein